MLVSTLSSEDKQMNETYTLTWKSPWPTLGIRSQAYKYSNMISALVWTSEVHGSLVKDDTVGNEMSCTPYGES